MATFSFYTIVLCFHFLWEGKSTMGITQFPNHFAHGHCSLPWLNNRDGITCTSEVGFNSLSNTKHPGTAKDKGLCTIRLNGFKCLVREMLNELTMILQPQNRHIDVSNAYDAVF